VKPHSLSCHHLDQGGVHDPGQVEADDGSAWVADDVGGDQRILRDTENPLILLGCSLLPERFVDLLRGGGPVRDEHDVGDRSDRDGRAYRDPVEPAGQLRYRAGGGSRRSGRGGH